MDVKLAFLNGELKEEIFVEKPREFEVAGKEASVYKLHRALYGLKQAPRAWNRKIDEYFMNQGFVKNSSQHTL